MRRFLPIFLRAALLVVCAAVVSTTIQAQTTAFTYQGRLSDVSMTTASGSYLIKFELYDAASNGNLIDTISDVPTTVSNGVFTVELNFTAANAFDGGERYLQISVKRNASDEYTTLSPRQRVTSTPYAIRALKAGSADTSTNATSATTATNATTADTATNAQQLGGVAASSYLQQNGSGANLTNLNAGSVSLGTLSDARLSANVALRNSANTFTGDQTINGNLTQTGTLTDLNLTNGFVARGAFGAGSIPATGEGSRMMFYPGKAAFRVGRVFNDSNNGATYWDDGNVGNDSFALGKNTRASGAGSFAFGELARALGERSFAVGNGALAGFVISSVNDVPRTANESMAFGSGAQATSDNALALGAGSSSNGIGSTAIGASLAGGNFSVAIGLQNRAMGQFSVAIGKNATDCSHGGCSGTQTQPNVVYNGVISISDACASFSSDSVTASRNNQVNIRGCGGFRFFTSQGTSPTQFGTISGVELAPGGSQWLSLSDRNSKENFKAVNSRDVLRKVLNLPITTWNYKSQDASIRHIGAMAQDFKAAFAVGEDDRHISALDPDGVAFAAIQGLNEELKDELKMRDQKIEQQQQQINVLQTQDRQRQKEIDELKKIVCALKPDAAGCQQEDK